MTPSTFALIFHSPRYVQVRRRHSRRDTIEIRRYERRYWKGGPLMLTDF